MHDFFQFLGFMVFWVFVAGVILVPVYLRHKDRERMHETLRLAYEKGQPVPPELIEALQSNNPVQPMNTPDRDLRRAVVLIAVGLGFVGLGYGLWYGLMSVDDTAAYVSGGSTAGFGAIPGLIGLAYLVLWFARRKTPESLSTVARGKAIAMAPSVAASASAHDLDLVALAATGSRPAFGELVRRHGSAVRGLLRRMGADPALADDLAQDAFLAAYEQIAEFRGEGTFQAWVRSIAARLYIRRWRRDKHLDFHPETPEPDDNGAAPNTGDRIDLDEALRRLPEVERVCVSLCYGAGLTNAEAASALNLPLGTVKSHVKRGLDKLRARLAPRSPGEAGLHG